MLILEPTIEFEPWVWMGEKAHKLMGTAQWDNSWGNYLKPLGIQPVYSGSWFIAVDAINNPGVIKKIVTLSCNDDFSLENIADRFSPLTGGYMLFNHNDVLFDPQCCCDLGDLMYWKQLTSLASENWYNLLMGHATMHARKIGDAIEIKEIPEYGNDEPIIEKVNQNDLQIALSKAEQKINAFQKKIIPVINEIISNDELSIKIAKTLTGQS